MKIIQLVGARPQFVKLAPISQLIRQSHKELIIHSGQHYDYLMNEVFFKQMGIPEPDYYLNIGSGSHGVQTARILEALEPVLITEKPDWLLVYGDTNTTLAGALASSKLGIRTAHVEACLRSFNKAMPEEINRIVADHLSDLLLVPTPTGMTNAKSEGLLDKARLVGDVMTDSLRMGLEAAHASGVSSSQASPYYLLTLHRPYNVDDPQQLVHILKSLNTLQQTILFPVHPRTSRLLDAQTRAQFEFISFLEPLGYLEFLVHMSGAEMVLTDSGGIQKEAYILKKPCVTLRTETEWLETVESGWNLLLPPQDETFPSAIRTFCPPQEHPSLFGENVSREILNLIVSS